MSDAIAYEAPGGTGLGAIAVLADEQRRRIHAIVRRARRPVTREEVAAAGGISAKLAAFHLDKLVAAGLLRTSYDNPAAIPRVGRRPKVYEPADIDIRVSIPERRADVIAGILVDAVMDTRPGEDPPTAAVNAARRQGEAIGQAARARVRPGRLGPERSVSIAEPILEQYGYEPDRPAPTHLRLLNCPFHQLVKRSPDLVCAINLALLDGLLDGMQAHGIEAAMVPTTTARCCVELRETAVDACARTTAEARCGQDAD